MTSFHPVRNLYSRVSQEKQRRRQFLTGFQTRVYEVVRSIPKGNVMTYKEVARQAGHFKAWRAVGNILNKNRNSKIPCHRVIRGDGKVGGFNRGTRNKIVLLRKEGLKIKKTRIIL